MMRAPLRTLLVCALPLIAACSDVSRGTLDSVRMAWHGQSKLAVTPEQVAARPFYQMHVTTESGDAILNLGNVDGERQFWYGLGGAMLVLEHGRVIQTLGFKDNLDVSRLVPGRDPFAAGLQTLQGRLAYERQDDWSPGYRYGIVTHFELVPTGATDINILGTQHHVLLVTENISAPAAGYRAVNRYWVDPQDGFIWMSEQHVVPGLTLKLVQLRPYRGNQP